MEKPVSKSSFRNFGLLTIALVIVLCHLTSARAQTQELRQVPTSVVEIKEQPGCPLSFELVSVEAPLDDRYIVVNLKLRNISQKPIVGIVITAEVEPGTGMADTTYRGAIPLAISEIQDEPLLIYSDDILSRKRSIRIDYVRFLDGNAWGDDLLKRSSTIGDSIDGSRAALTELIAKCSNLGSECFQQIKTFANDRHAALNVPDNKELEGRTLAYKGGYRHVFSILNRPEYSKPHAFLEKVEGLRTSLANSDLPKP
jgi:hypothetical protein